MLGAASVALSADLLVGEPPTHLHPTVWMGRWVAAGRSRRRARLAPASLLEGALLVGGGCLLAATLSAAVDRLIDAAPALPRTMLRAAALKPALSLSPLVEAAHEVQHALERGRLAEARRSLAWHLVSRDSSALSAAEVAGAAIESVAENLGDSVVAPLLAFRAGGLSGAYAYRLINTADAMLGYRTPELEWFGKTAARADDLLNLVPARLAALLICGTAAAGGGSAGRAWTTARRDAARTPSPNAGWPMAAMAGALGVRLTKRGHYSLNDRDRDPRPNDIARSCRIALAAATLAALFVDLV